MPTRVSRGPHLGPNEFHLIQQVKQLLGFPGRSVSMGIGDDAAIVNPKPKQQTLLSTDILIEHIHFDLTYTTLTDVGYKAAVANLSDIAAMGGTPHYMLVGVALPPSLRNIAPIKQLYRGLRQACQRHQVSIIGGDTSASLHDLFVSLTIIGENAKGWSLTRKGAQIGDLLYVTGTVGDSLCGLKIFQQQKHNKTRSLPQSVQRAYQFLMARHLRPTPRLELGHILSAKRIATAAIDLSDGLSGDLHHLCQQSKVGAEIEESLLPLSPAFRQFAAHEHSDPTSLALQGGEDYELLFTIPPKNQNKLDKVTKALKYPLTRIGTIRAKRFGLRLTSKDGTYQRITGMSYQHFANDPSQLRHRHA